MRDIEAREGLARALEQVGELITHVGNLGARLLEVERRPAVVMPHVVLKPGEVLVCTGAEGLSMNDIATMRASVDAMGLKGRVIIISESMRAEIARVALCACGSGLPAGACTNPRKGQTDAPE